MGIIIVIRRKISLIYRENSFIFNLPISMLLFVFRRDIIGRNNNSAAIPTLEEGLLHKNKRVLNYLT
jgi:hypothetical protein